MRLNLGDDYIERVFAKFPDVKDSVDFCSYWFRIAHDNLDENGRAGLVATNSSSQGKSRVASLDYIAQNGGYIHDAVSTQEWSGEAKVHVSIANWCKIQPNIYRLDGKDVSKINTSLQSEIDVTHAVRLKANLNIGFQGVIPIGKGFYVDFAKVEEWIKADPKNKDVLKLSCSASDLTDVPNGLPSRWIIDFNDMSFEEAITYKLPFKHLELTVQPERKSNRRDVTRINWWKYGEKRPLMRESLASLSCYFIAPSHSKWFIFLLAQLDWLPNNSITVITSDDFYVLGILTSKVHRLWVKAQSSTLKGDTRYTHNFCFETFPFPQIDHNTPTNKGLKPLAYIEKIRATMQELHQYRSKEMDSQQYGITKLYNSHFHQEGCNLYKLHAKLDKLVMQAYGFSEDDDILSKLLELNLELAEREKQGLPVIGARG